MSTKKIREALDRLANAYAALKDTPTNNLVGDAYAEVEAIERASRVVSEWGICSHGGEPGFIPGTYDEVDAAKRTVDSIAKEAP